MSTRVVFALLLFLHLLAIFTTTNISFFCNGSTYVGCIESERQALMRFKQDLTDPSNRLASWNNIIDHGDCCANWVGVVCDNFTGHVLELHLRNPVNTNPFSDDVSDPDEYEAYERSMLGGKINPSLLDLKHLIYLDLSNNDFQGTQIPRFFSFMRNLRYLNLSGAGFVGMIPHQLGNLSNLQYLGLGQNYWDILHVENLSWLSGLSLLKHLDLSVVDLSKASDWLLVINKLPSLEVLRLSGCQLNHFPPLSKANFSSLAILDLSNNQFDSSLTPSWIFGLSDLVFLDLHTNNFQGSIPDGLQNLTCLRHLDLSDNHFNSSIPNWLCKFGYLEYLSLSRNSLLRGTISSALGDLTSSIKTLDLSFTRIEGRIPRSFGRLCKLKSVILSEVKLSQEISEVLDIFSECVSDGLETLNLDSSQLSGLLTNQLQNFKNLNTLRLQNNSISGSIPLSLGELSSLISFDLSYNKLNGSIPFSLGKLSSLRDLSLAYNKLDSHIPLTLGQLSYLRNLDLSYNKLVGNLFEIHITNLTRLTNFVVSGNSLVLKVSPNWVPPFQLQRLYLSSCHIGPQIPSWLHSQKSLSFLEISNSGIVDSIPSWLWKFPSQFFYLNLSHNQIYGEIPKVTEVAQLESLDLSSNNLSGPLPLVSSNVHELDLSNNALSGSIFQFLCHEMNEYSSKGMKILNLGENVLSGELANCWMNWKKLLILNLNNNNFTGSIPTSMGALTSLRSLHLRKSGLSGKLPSTLENCRELVALDISENEFVGNVPIWIGEKFSKIIILNLRSNKFHGHFPLELCHLTSLQILDLAYNSISGGIPKCINNFSAMATVSYSAGKAIIYTSSYSLPIEDASLVTKGKAVEYNTILNLVRIIDLSENNFSGEIPTEITNLGALQSLNLSHNFLIGRIPENIGAMTSLESIDFSGNQLSGKIPQSISNLTFLSHLNLSDNKLTGRIPLTTQLQGFDASSFTGNELCGSPLPWNCTVDDVPVPDYKNGEGKDGDKHEVDWFYVGMALGFVVGFWVVIGPLLVSWRWRCVYYHTLDCLRGKLGRVVRKYCW